ncbi:hypothetical protein ACXLRA_004229 [Vibrio vulnificus]|nr:hypothetical protein [Vibrio vulnificus]
MLDKKLVSLHKHWLAADAIQQVVAIHIDDSHELAGDLLRFAKYHSMFQRLSVWYALIYVVVEGYKELQYVDTKIDRLLSRDDLVNNLRLFRNATFHYQKAPVSEKVLKFLTLEEGQAWVHELHVSFEEFFIAQLPIEQTLNQLRKA